MEAADRQGLSGRSTTAAPVEVYEEVITDHLSEAGALVERRSERRTLDLAVPCWLPAGSRPVMTLGTSTHVDERGVLRLLAPALEEVADAGGGQVVVRRRRREVRATRSTLTQDVIAQVDGARTAEQIVDTFPERDRPFVQELLAHFASLGIVDVSGRWTGRLLHAATKKGVARADELGADEVERLVTDGDYRRYPGAPRHPLPEGGPPELNALRGILATRRSPRAFTGTVRRTELEAILTTACAVTGVVPRASGELRLRAYPSSGALYAVECYPVALAVDGLDTGVYHVCPDERALELVRRHSDISHFVQAALPSERDMLAQAGALICLTGAFPRHERKYGGGGYRMLVAEAGHLSQTIVLAATALGLAARPFGGVIDDLLNAALGLETEEEQFILGVLVGYDGTV